MNYFERTFSALQFIESALCDEISGDEVAFNSAFSRFHFHRIFLAITGKTIKEYIIARRMTEAARELIQSDKPIIDIAYDYQYQTQESFTKAFRKYFGTSPGRYRRNNIHLDGLYMNPLELYPQGPCSDSTFFFAGFVDKPGFHVVGLTQHCTTAKLNNGLPDLWKLFASRENEVQHRSDYCHGYGVCLYNEANPSREFDYLAGIEVSETGQVPAGMRSHSIDAHRYAVFTAVGIQNIVPAYRYAVGSWFKENCCSWVSSPDFEYYDERFDQSRPFDSELDIYIPVSF